jgi:hypothetical protein
MRDVNVGEKERETWNESVRLRERKRECGEREEKRRERNGNILTDSRERH